MNQAFSSFRIIRLDLFSEYFCLWSAGNMKHIHLKLYDALVILRCYDNLFY